MKIVPKLTAALMLGTCLVLGVNGYFRVRRVLASFEEDRRRDHEVIGRSLAAAASAAWKLDGASGALASVEAVNKPFTRIRIGWIAIDAPNHLGNGVLASAPAAEPITTSARHESGARTWYTYVPVDVDGRRRGALELVEEGSTEERFVTAALLDTVRTGLSLAVLSAVLSFIMGQWLVGRPVRALADKARRIAMGDFTGHVVLEQDDELCDLAVEMNAMCDRLATTLEQLRHADRLATVGKLASGVAHELGTPLNVISARAGMIADDTTPEESKEYARVIGTAAERMTKIIRQLLQFARRTTIETAATDVQVLADDTLGLLRPLAAKRSVALQLEPSTGTTIVPADAGQLQQVITNLVMNAVQATPEGGRVTLRWYEEGSRFLCLDVADDGEGIRPEDIPRIFEPFFTTKDIGEGTGLGLAVSYGIVSDHGGTIEVRSALEKGTTFTVRLPTATS